MTQKGIFNLPIGAGQYTEQSERGAVGRWYKMDKVRFRKGLAEKIGGWVREGPEEFIGICRRLKDWSSLDRKRWVAIATDSKLYVRQRDNLYDITPLRASGALTAGPFTTFSGEVRVLVAHTNHGCQTGDYVTFFGADVGGASGITVDGEYRVQVASDVDQYEIYLDATVATGSSGEGGAGVTYEYQISAGARTSVAATGYGSGPYGREGYGNARTGSRLVLGIRTWSLDTWGEDLLACPSGGKIYWWDRSKGTGTRAQPLGNLAPIQNESMIVSQRDRHIIALGAYDYFNDAPDPLLIRWGSTEDLNDWIPTSTNTAGDLRLYSGSKIVTGVRSRLETVIFTDVSVHTLPFVGGFDVFGLNIVGENVSILSPNAAVPIDHRVLFMAESDFYVYDGIVKVVNCDVRNFVYDYLNADQREKVYGGLNREFNEVWWFYPAFDNDAWVQTSFDLQLPQGYSLANASTSTEPSVVFQNNWEGSGGDKTDTEQSSNAAVVTTQYGSLSTVPFKYGATSAFGGFFEADWIAPYIPAYELGSNDWCIESQVYLDQLPSGDGIDEWSVVNRWGPGGEAFAINLMRRYLGDGYYKVFVRVRLGATTIDVDIDGGFNQGDWEGDIELSDTLEEAWSHLVVERINDTIWVGWNGIVEGNGSFTGAVPASTQDLYFFDKQTGGWSTRMHLDETRITVGGNQYSLHLFSTYLQPTGPFGPPAAGGDGQIGYTYFFNGAGFTEAISTAAGAYQHDYFLTNCEPILAPLNGEYAVELGLSAVSAVPAGLSFLRKDLVGTANSVEDDAKEWVVEIDQDTDTIQILRSLSTGGLAPPNNLGGGANVLDFAALTGASVAYDTDPDSFLVSATHYTITVRVDEPQITVWVETNNDGDVLAFQFDMDAAELAEFQGESCMGLHVRPAATASNWQFFNLASGPVGVISDPTFDISPTEVNRYVIYNYEEGTWATGKMSRTAWADRSPLFEKPYATKPSANGLNSLLYLHETGTDDGTAAMSAFIESFDMEIPEAGEELMHVDQLIPDFLTLEGSVDVELTGRKYPQAARLTKGPYTVVPATRKLSTRMRARQVAIKVTSSDTGDRWRMGHWRGRAGAHGKRG